MVWAEAHRHASEMSPEASHRVREALRKMGETDLRLKSQKHFGL